LDEETWPRASAVWVYKGAPLALG